MQSVHLEVEYVSAVPRFQGQVHQSCSEGSLDKLPPRTHPSFYFIKQNLASLVLVFIIFLFYMTWPKTLFSR